MRGFVLNKETSPCRIQIRPAILPLATVQFRFELALNQFMILFEMSNLN